MSELSSEDEREVEAIPEPECVTEIIDTIYDILRKT
jgi:hypothetical protein